MTFTESIAAEHCRWCRWEARMQPDEVIRSVGLPVRGIATWDAALDAVAHAYTTLAWRARVAA